MAVPSKLGRSTSSSIGGLGGKGKGTLSFKAKPKAKVSWIQASRLSPSQPHLNPPSLGIWPPPPPLFPLVFSSQATADGSKPLTLKPLSFKSTSKPLASKATEVDQDGRKEQDKGSSTDAQVSHT